MSLYDINMGQGHSPSIEENLSAPDYKRMAEFRYRIRQFVRFSEDAARAHGIEPQQHQLMLAIKGLPLGMRPTVTTISERMCLRHNSTVELINRLASGRALVKRHHSDEDRREVLVELTPYGDEILRRLSVLHWQELQTAAPALSKALQAIINQKERS
jgi:DNA-binding MarR family transcriptional regulator